MALDFPHLLRLIDDRSAAFRSAIASAPSLDAKVPTCPEWTLLDLVQHLGNGRRKWAAIVAAGPAGAPPDYEPVPAPVDRADQLAWLAASTAELLEALREAGPDRGCWTWWGGGSQAPSDCGAVARHQLQEIAVHAYDAQLTAGDPQLPPAELAIDGIEEFQFTTAATTVAWPHEPAVVDFRTTEGPAWRYTLSASGAHTTDLTSADTPDAAMQGPAAEVLLVLYDRLPFDAVDLTGDTGLFDKIWAWNP